METSYSILIIALIFIILWIFYYLANSGPLEEIEIEELSLYRRFSESVNFYGFEYYNVDINKDFKKNLTTDGGFYNVNENLRSFPSLIASLLKGKKHEWVVVSFSKNDKVIGFWTNKGFNNQSVTPFRSWDYFISKAKENDVDTIMMFHNHTNAVLESSDADVEVSKIDGKKVVENGYNFLTFVVARGSFKQYAWWFNDNFLPLKQYRVEVEKINGESRQMNYNLRKELRKKSRFKELKLIVNRTSNNIFN